MNVQGLSDLAWTENSRKIATASDDKLIKIFDVETVGFPSISFPPRLSPDIYFYLRSSTPERESGGVSLWVFPFLRGGYLSSFVGMTLLLV